jgi:hypothetical protein
MKKHPLILLSVFFLFFSSFKAGEKDNAFFAFIDKAGLKFSKPANTIEIPVIANDELNYQYALKDTINKIEIRYLVVPLQELVDRYNGPHDDTGSSMSKVDPNFLHTNLLIAYALKIEGKGMNSMDDVMPNITELSHAKVDLEYNADWGAELTLQPCDEFAQKYKYCNILAIHKDNIADVFMIYLYDNKDTFEESVKPDIHSLVFKKT